MTYAGGLQCCWRLARLKARTASYLPACLCGQSWSTFDQVFANWVRNTACTCDDSVQLVSLLQLLVNKECLQDRRRVRHACSAHVRNVVRNDKLVQASSRPTKSPSAVTAEAAAAGCIGLPAVRTYQLQDGPLNLLRESVRQVVQVNHGL
jgi:hypothetical protein